MNYESKSFKDLNKELMESEEPSRELISWTISKGIDMMEIYIAKISFGYGIKITRLEIEEVTNQVLDNVIKYFDIKKSKNLMSYMYITARGKFLNYFRDKIRKIDNSLDEDLNLSKLKNYRVLYNNSHEDIDDYYEKQLMIKDAFNKLNDRCKKGIYYKKYLNYSIKEIMTLMELKTMTEANLRKAISNCFKTLKQLIFGGEINAR